MVRLSDDHFVRDSLFDPAAYWKAMSRDFEKMSETTPLFYPALLQLTTDAFAILREYVPERLTKLEAPNAPGWLSVRVLFLSPHEAQMNVLGLGNQVRVVEPAALQQAVIAIAEAIIAAQHS